MRQRGPTHREQNLGKVMVCVRCNKELNKPFLIVGQYAYGQKCAKIAGLANTPKKKAEKVTRDLRTLDLFE
jgi:hypothetical protein